MSLEVRAEGLYCIPGDFYIDAWTPVSTCIVTHGHVDHARAGHKRYVCHQDNGDILKKRLGSPFLQLLTYSERIRLGECWVSLHPAGHILGSAQVRIETSKEIIVISGDYKRAYDFTCESFEVVECDTFVTESTFALPIYRWENPRDIAKQIFAWWEGNQTDKRPSVLFCYALGKAQRILSMLASFTDRPVYAHGAILPLTEIYDSKGIKMLPCLPIEDKFQKFEQDLILAPPSAMGSPWMKRFPKAKLASASGWMQVRGQRRRRGMDQGFVLSDHADWDGILRTILETNAKTVITTHGYSSVLAKYLREEKGIHAYELGGLESSEEGEG